MSASLLDYQNRVDRELAIHAAKARLRDAHTGTSRRSTGMAKRPLTITAPLPGWIRMENVIDGRMMDFNPADPTHAFLLKVYQARQDWKQVATPCPADVENDSTGQGVDCKNDSR